MASLVIKVGGSTLSSPGDYLEAARRIAVFVEQDVKPVVVVSAARGVTDKLLKACDGDRGALKTVQNLYLGIAEGLSVKAVKVVDGILSDLYRLLESIGYKCDVRLEDYIVSFGEVISKILIAQALEDNGLKVTTLNAVDLIETDGVHGDARINYDVTRLNLSKAIGYADEMRSVAVIEGFIGRGVNGSTVTLGRGGSDYTAIAIATLTRIPEVILVTDVPGVLSIDPTLSPRARLVDILNYREALEASRYGVKKFNPKSFEPIALGFGRPRVLIGNWSIQGTLVEDSPRWAPGPKIVASTGKESDMVAVIGEGVEVKRFLSKLLEILDENMISELRISKMKPSITLKTPPESSALIARIIHDHIIAGDRR